jgi:hypothetical protein
MPATPQSTSRRGRASMVLLAGGLLAVCAPRVAHARNLRPLFEPTDLEMEQTGVVEIDVQVGAIRGQGPWRVVMPDFELDVGVLSWLELDLDGAYAIEGPTSGPFSFDHSAPDSLWPCLKLALPASHDSEVARALSVGMQLGPKVPIAAGSHGIGFEGLVLVGYALGPLNTVLNLGGFADPAPDAAAGRPIGLEGGVDLELQLGSSNRYSLTGELSGVRFVTDDPHQLLATAGFKWAATQMLDLSIIGLWGFLAGSDRYGVLLGISPKVRMLR